MHNTHASTSSQCAPKVLSTLMTPLHPQSLHGSMAPRRALAPTDVSQAPMHLAPPLPSHLATPAFSTTPSPPYPRVSCTICPCLVPHLMSTCTHMSPCVLMAPRHARAPNDAPRPTANASHAPYSRSRPQTMPHIIPACTPHSPCTHAAYHLHTASARHCGRTCCLGAQTMRRGSVWSCTHAR